MPLSLSKSLENGAARIRRAIATKLCRSASIQLHVYLRHHFTGGLPTACLLVIRQKQERQPDAQRSSRHCT